MVREYALLESIVKLVKHHIRDVVVAEITLEILIVLTLSGKFLLLFFFVFFLFFFVFWSLLHGMLYTLFTNLGK